MVSTYSEEQALLAKLDAAQIAHQRCPRGCSYIEDGERTCTRCGGQMHLLANGDQIEDVPCIGCGAARWDGCDCCPVCHAPPDVDCDCAERAQQEAA